LMRFNKTGLNKILRPVLFSFYDLFKKVRLF